MEQLNQQWGTNNHRDRLHRCTGKNRALYDDIGGEEEKRRVIIYCRIVLDGNAVSINRKQLYHRQAGERRKKSLYYYSYATHHYTGKYIFDCTRRTIIMVTLSCRWNSRYTITHTSISQARSYITINSSNTRWRGTMICTIYYTFPIVIVFPYGT